MTPRLIAPIAVLTLAAAPLAAHDYRHGTLAIAHPWARQTVAGQTAGGGFMTVANRGRTADRLIGATSPVAARVEIHQMTMDGGVMRMRPVTGGLAIPAGGTLDLKPGGYHLMLTGLKAPLALGQSVPLTLRFARAGSVTVQLKVEPVSHGAGGGHERH